MTEEQKEILIAKMLDAPSSLSDEELEMIVHDDELRDIYKMSSAVSNAYVRQPELDMEAEWRRFRPCIQRKPAMIKRFMRVAAIFSGVILASGVAVNIIDNALKCDQQPVIARVEQSRITESAPALPSDQQTAETKDNIQIRPKVDKGLSDAPTRHIAKAKISKLKANVSQVETEIDINEYLRIQQARIDNELAMQVAESYMEEYADIAPYLDMIGANNPDLVNAIRKVTME